MNQLEIRTYQEGDEEGIRKLMTSQYDSVKWETTKYWNWRYKKNPSGFEPKGIWLAIDDGEIVAQYAVQPIDVWLYKTPMKAVMSLDTITHPNYRRRGLFTKLAQKTYASMVKKGYELVFGFPGPMSVRGFEEKLKWKRIRDMRFLAYIFNSQKVSEYYGKKKMLFINPYIKLSNIVKSIGIDENSNYFSEEELDKHWFKNFLQNLNAMRANRTDFILKKYYEHLKWRYSDPTAENEILFLNGGIIGIKIRQEKGICVANILDINLYGAKREFVARALKFCKDRDVDVCFSWDMQEQKILKRVGFLDIRKTIPFGIRCFSREEGKKFRMISYPNNVDISMGDSDY